MAKPTFSAVGGSSAVFTPASFAAACREFGAELTKPSTLAMRRVMRKVRVFAQDDFRSRGIGRRIWGEDNGKKSNLGAFIRAITKADGPIVKGTLDLRGLPALQEKGGRTESHEIAGKNGKKLLSSGPGGIFFAPGPVMHPGSVVRRIPFADAAMARGTALLPAELEKEVQKLIRAKGLA